MPKVTDPHLLSQLGTGGQVALPNPMFPGQLQGQSLNNQRTQQEINQAQATASATTEKTKAEAKSATLAAKTAQEAYDAAHPKGTGATVIGPDSLKNLSVPDQELVKALADGRLAFPGGFALKAPWWQQKLEQVAQYDPTFDATNFNNRAKARAMLLTGKVGASANALNTAIGHLGLLGDQVGGTASHGPWSIGGIPIPGATTVNALENAAKRSSGQPGITNFQDTAQKLADELESVYRNGGGAEQGVVRQLRSLDPNMSAEQKTGIVRNALELLASKQAANLYQYNIGSEGKPAVDLLDPAARAVLDKSPDIRDKYFAATPAPLSGQAAALLKANGGTMPPPPSAPRPSGGPPPVLGGGGITQVTPPDYSGIAGGPQQGLASTAYRNEYDPVVSAGMNALVHKGVPYEQAAAYAQSHGGTVPDPGQYAAAVTYAASHPHWMAAEANRSIPTTLGERAAASPLAAGIVGAGTGASAGLSDTVGRHLFGPSWDANRRALAATNPTADFAGNMAGGVAAALVAPELAARYAPGATASLAQLAARAPKTAATLGDMAYGGLYGANESPNNPVSGATLGALTGAGAGFAGRKVAGGLSGVVAPSAGPFAPAYEAGVFPTLGQKLSATGGIPGKIANTAEQAMQSFPGLGMMVAGARQAPRDAAQVGAFNNSLKELAPFGQSVGSSLPPGVGPGTEAHAFTKNQFDKAYDTARQGMQFVPDQQYLIDASKLAQKVGSGVLDPNQAQQVGKVVNNAVVGRLKAQNGVLNGDAYKAASSDLASTIQTWGKNPATAPMADALSDYQTIFDNAARRNSDPQAVHLLDSADRGYAQLVRIQRASELGGAAKDAGTFTPVNYAGAVKQMGGGVRSSAYNQGTALGQDYANAILPLKDTLPNSGTSERLLTSQALAGLGGGEVGAGDFLAAHPATLVPFAAYVPGVRDLVARGIAPNAQRLSLLPPDIAAALDRIGVKINDAAPYVGKGAVPGTLAYYAQ